MLVDAALALAESDQADANRAESAKGFEKPLKSCRGLALVKAGALELLQHLAEPLPEASQKT